MARRKLDIDNLPSNDLEPREDKDVEEVVTTGHVKTRKSGGLSNEIRNIGNALFGTIILPAMKGAVGDFFHSGIDMIMSRNDPVSSHGRHTSYSGRYQQRQRTQRSGRRPRRQKVRHVEHVFEDIFFDDRRDAEEVLGRMMELIVEYGRATMGDLHQMCGLASNYTYEQYEWNDLRSCRVLHTTEGYLIDFPEPYAS